MISVNQFFRKNEHDTNDENKENEDPTEQQEIEESNSEPVASTSKPYELDKMTPQRLKEIVKEKLQTAAVQAEADRLLVYLKNLCNSEPYLNKFTYMIQLNMDGWRHNDKLKFVQWYNRQLERIISNQS